MAGVTLSLEAPGLADAVARLSRMAPTAATAARITDAAGAVAESGVRRRLGETKRAPDGARWAGWSVAYGETRRPGQSLLQSEGDLLDSVQSLSTLTEAQVGSNLVYAAIHQFGGEDVGIPIPPRPYLGLDDADRPGIEDAVAAILTEPLR